MARVTAERLAQMRKQRTSSLQHTCRVRQTAGTADAYNADAASWPTVNATVACTVPNRSGQASGQGGIIDVLSNQRSKTIVLSYDLVQQGITIAAPDRIEWVQGGITYEVASVDDPGSFGIDVVCQCIEVDRG